MYKSLIFICAVCFVITEARPRWQYLPKVPGYVPVYIQNGDTPLEDINPELAEAFHAWPAGRSAGKRLEAAQDAAEAPEQADGPAPDAAPEPADAGPRAEPHENLLEKSDKTSVEVIEPNERK